MRRILKAQVRFLSLCPKGANRLPALYKEDQPNGKGEIDFDARMLTKAAPDFKDKGELLAVVYAPDMVDSHGEYAPADVIREAMHDAAKSGLNVDIRHDEKALSKDDAYVAESFEIQKGDPRFADLKDYEGNPVDVTGGWGVLIKINNPDLRELYRKGEWQGISMGGSYLPEMAKADGESVTLLKRIAALLGLKNTYAHQSISLSGDIDMTGEELTKMLEVNNEKLAKAITEGLTSALKKEDGPASKKDDPEPLAAPMFKGDHGDAQAVEAHRMAVIRYNLAKDVDWANPDSIAEYQAKLSKLSDGSEGVKEGTDQAEALRKAIEQKEQELARLRKASSVPDGDGQGSTLTKEQQEISEAADEMSKLIKEKRPHLYA